MNAVTASRQSHQSVTNESLCLAVWRSDFSGLMNCAADMRVAGYQVDPFSLATVLQERGEAVVRDAFGHRVAVRLREPENRVVHTHGVTAFRLAL